MQRIALGSRSFRDLRSKHSLYVDKTASILELLCADVYGSALGPQSQVSLITRPRRFGKTLWLSMLSEFFDLAKKPEGTLLFEGLEILKYHELCAAWMHQFPVVFLSMNYLRTYVRGFVKTVPHF